VGGCGSWRAVSRCPPPPPTPPTPKTPIPNPQGKILNYKSNIYIYLNKKVL